MTEEILQDAEPRVEDRLAWHKPGVRHITISIATGDDFLKEGSDNDLALNGNGHFVNT
jgi:hypothetical protein